MMVFEWTITHPVGLYAKLADGLVTIANRFVSNIEVSYLQKKVSMKSLMGVISLGVPCQGTICIEINGNDAHEAKTAIEHFLKDNMSFLFFIW